MSLKLTTSKYSTPEEISIYDAAHNAMSLALIDVYRASAATRDGSFDYDETEAADFIELEARYKCLKTAFDSMTEPRRPSRLEEAIADAQVARGREEEAEDAIYAVMSRLQNSKLGTVDSASAQIELDSAIVAHKAAADAVWTPMMNLIEALQIR